MKHGVTVALAVGLFVIAVAIGVVLSHAPFEVLASNHVAADEVEAFVHREAGDCQQGGTIPAGTSAIRVSLSANIGPQVSLRVLSGSRILAKGRRPAGWGEDASVTVPIRKLDRTVEHSLVCIRTGRPIEYLQIRGTRVAASSSSGENIAGARLRLEYLRPGGSSWISRAPSIAHRLGLGGAAGGPWIAYGVLLAMAAVIALAARLARKELS